MPIKLFGIIQKGYAMDVKSSLTRSDYYATLLQKPQAAGLSAKPSSLPVPHDTVSIHSPTTNKTVSPQLIEEHLDKLDNGFRRIQEFKTSSGQSFTRMEEVTTSTDRTRRLIVQQNAQGSTTMLESVYDRQQDGSFRQIQRFTDTMGITQTNVVMNVLPADAGIILGQSPSPDSKQSPTYNPRGSVVNITT